LLSLPGAAAFHRDIRSRLPFAAVVTMILRRLEKLQSALSSLSLKDFLGSRHKKRMPNFILSRADTDDVIAYILSLKRK
jgi:hypothetical protein